MLFFSSLLKSIFRQHLLTKGTINGEDQVLGQSSLTFLALGSGGEGKGMDLHDRWACKQKACKRCTELDLCAHHFYTLSPPLQQHAFSPTTSTTRFRMAQGLVVGCGPGVWGPLF
uniref:Uncharacterized protein n=1 Tax=Micrurus paraensis TaxID=1970185 RepID=A0A2D4JX80_9SAUR